VKGGFHHLLTVRAGEIREPLGGELKALGGEAVSVALPVTGRTNRQRRFPLGG